MQARERDPFGLDMLPEADTGEMEDEEIGLTEDMLLPQLGRLHRIVEPDFTDRRADAANLT